VTPVHQRRNLDCRGAAEVDDRIHRRPNGPSRKHHIFDEDHGLSAHRDGHGTAAWNRAPSVADHVVAVERDVEDPERNFVLGDLPEPFSQKLGDRHAPLSDGDQDQISRLLVSLQDLVSDP
jgi:hypothetical protein